MFLTIFSVADPCIYFPLKESACPRKLPSTDCHHDLQSDELCEADNPLPYKNSNNDINNCINNKQSRLDMFKCKRGIEHLIYFIPIFICTNRVWWFFCAYSTIYGLLYNKLVQ